MATQTRAIGAAAPGIPPGLKDGLRRMVGVGPIVGAVVAGVFMYLPTHQISASTYTAVLMFLIIGTLRAVDRYLTPLWEMLGLIPMPVRLLASVVIPVLYSISRFQPDASGQEVGRARGALIASAVIAYVLNRPRKSDRAST